MSDMKNIEDVTLEPKIEGYIVNPATGDKIECDFKDLTDSERRELFELEEQAEDGDEDAADEFEELIVGKYFLSDKITPESPLAQKQAVIAGFVRALGADNAVVEDARDLVEQMDQQGNQ